MNSSTKKYEVISKSQPIPWATFDTSIEASEHIRLLTKEIEGINFSVKCPPQVITDEVLEAEFDHLDFGVSA